MATVRITYDIRAHVKARFTDLYRARIERKTEELQHLDIGNYLYEHMVSEKYRRLAKELNEDQDGNWIEVSETITVKIRYATANTKEPFKVVTFRVPFKPPVPLPQRMKTWNYFCVLKENMAPYAHAKKILMEVDALVDERDKLIEQIVDGVLTTCSTLRQVLEVWPTALDFMPEDVKQLHMKPSQKRQSTTKEVVIDEDVKVSLMKARMLASSK